ncbi:MAG TPA: DUF2059 domain-containing protein, partial [Duganella sp.]|nr:DUF2059 domain-containing protein [Duganella sp.]
APAPAPVAADIDPAAMTAARELFDAMNYRPMMKDMMVQMVRGMEGSMRPMLEQTINANNRLGAAEKKKALARIEQKLPEMNKLLAEFVSDPTLVDEMLAQAVPLYARNYSVDELHQIAAFYRTPVGAKLLATMPKLSAEMMQGSQALMGKRMGPMLQKVTTLLEN